MEMDLVIHGSRIVGYEGSSGHHSLYNYDATALGDILGAPQNPLVNSVNTFGSQGKANNNMLLAGIKHQFSHTFSAEAQYTWAHSMDTDSGPYSATLSLQPLLLLWAVGLRHQPILQALWRLAAGYLPRQP
jgi:hypothetical protein